MKPISLFMCMFAVTAVPALAQQWEIGLGAGYGVSTGADIKNSTGAVRGSFNRGPALGVYGGQNGSRISCEMHYAYKFSDLRLEGQGQTATMTGEVHSAHFDFLVHPRQNERTLQPFVAMGAGIRYYRGTGAEHATQPLGTFALLTHTNEVKPLLAPAVGIKAKMGRRTLLRLEVRDYITPFPSKVVAPYSGDSSSWQVVIPPPPLTLGPTGRTGASVSGWLHDFTPMVSIGFTF